MGTPIETTLANLSALTLEVRTVAPEWAKDVVAKAGTSKFSPDDPKGGEGDGQGLLLIYASDKAKFDVPYTEFLARLRTIDTRARRLLGDARCQCAAEIFVLVVVVIINVGRGVIRASPHFQAGDRE